MRRIYIRENKPLWSYSERKEMKIRQSYSRKFVGIGWKCEACGELIMDNDKKYVPFEKYHILEFDYKQLQRNMDKISLEQE